MKNLLIIEDDLQLAFTLRESLKQHGFNTTIVDNGRKGYKYAISKHFDCLLVDYKLPEMNGDEIINNLRVRDIETPVLMLTGQASSEHLAKSFRIGVDDYLSKPFSHIELIARIERLISKPPMLRYSTHKIGEIEIDFQGMCIRKDAFCESLTKREHKLLEFLILNKNCMVSRDRLVSNVWLDKPDITHNTVDCYISNLRKKLKRIKAKDFIETSHGYGYLCRI
ncbi:MAG TPA: response regulator transcription factor [Candidatus Dojkabacteria bacterium]|nr:response regulator transcription factor [Candidatus Dojkabacteria bacterium]HRP50861.1 response regulator transcription factor [Candidatus Dojkabacteria bacterium]